MFENPNKTLDSYSKIVKPEGRASKCVECGRCETHCPQHISIIEDLKEASKVLEKNL